MESETDVEHERKWPRKSWQQELALQPRGGNPTAQRSEEDQPAEHETERSGTSRLMEAVVHPRNISAALKRVKKNKGSPGIDGMTVDQLPAYLDEHWNAIREQLLTDCYRPRPVLRRQIPKAGGGMRELGIPCALDRMIQQAILQVLQPRFDPTFSQHSYGFRPGRSAHGAIGAAQRYAQEGREWVVDVDLERFFDRVQHDVLMGRLAKRIADPRMLRLIRRYLEAGVLVHGVVIERHEGTPQGGPLSPLLANVLLDDVDKELERRGHAFVRYADDCNVYVRSRRAAERVMKLLERLYASLRLRINTTKSAVALAWGRKLLGYCLRKTRSGEVRRAVAPKALAILKEEVRARTRRSGGRSITQVIATLGDYLRGWQGYFRYAQQRSSLEAIDAWIRHRLRAIYLKQWRTGRAVRRALRALGVPEERARRVARCASGGWRAAGDFLHIALPIAHFRKLGLPELAA
jgi:group II intron reverse transcriptase/maturase